MRVCCAFVLYALNFDTNYVHVKMYKRLGPVRVRRCKYPVVVVVVVVVVLIYVQRAEFCFMLRGPCFLNRYTSSNKFGRGWGILESPCPSVLLTDCPALSSNCLLNRPAFSNHTLHGGSSA